MSLLAFLCFSCTVGTHHDDIYTHSSVRKRMTNCRCCHLQAAKEAAKKKDKGGASGSAAAPGKEVATAGAELPYLMLLSYVVCCAIERRC